MREYVLELECGHNVSEQQRHIHSAYCSRCGRDQMIARRHDGYSIACTDCTYGRRFGLSGVSARSAALRHGRLRTGHTILVKLGGETVAKIFFAGNTDELFDIPPY